MDMQKLENLLRTGETICVEFKRAGDGAKNDTFESICAFLNRMGGDILLGVSDDGKVIGIPPNSAEQIIRNIINVTNDSNLLNPSFYVYPEAISYQVLSKDSNTSIDRIERVEDKNSKYFSFRADGDMVTVSLTEEARKMKPGKYTVSYKVYMEGAAYNVKPATLKLTVTVK